MSGMDEALPKETLIRLLPPSCRLLLEEGMPVAALMALIRRFGGSTVHVPSRIDESSLLAQAIGLESARMMASHCGRLSFYVPRAIVLERHCRDVAILREYDQGVPLRGIASAHQISARTVGNVVAKHGRPKRIGQRQPSTAQSNSPLNRIRQE